MIVDTVRWGWITASMIWELARQGFILGCGPLGLVKLVGDRGPVLPATRVPRKDLKAFRLPALLLQV